MKPSVVIPLSIQRMFCSGCGAEANASCNCGVSYMPASKRAAEAIAANPEKSNRAIAEELGVDEKTVRKERTADQSAVDTRIGRDGRTRRLPDREIRELSDADAAAVRDDSTMETDVEPEHYESAFWLRMDLANRAAIYSGPVNDDIIAMARQIAVKWENLALEMEKRK
jgi:hypothetical protein